MEAEAIADYVQVQGDEFSLTVGQQINILDNSGDFYLAHMEGEERYVPGNYVKMKHQVYWFLGHIERLEAEEILRNPSVPHGAFLVRNHQQKTDVREKESPFSLSVRNMYSEHGIQHYQIHKSKEGQYYLYPEPRRKALRATSPVELQSRRATIPPSYNCSSLGSVARWDTRGSQSYQHQSVSRIPLQQERKS